MKGLAASVLALALAGCGGKAAPVAAPAAAAGGVVEQCFSGRIESDQSQPTVIHRKLDRAAGLITEVTDQVDADTVDHLVMVTKVSGTTGTVEESEGGFSATVTFDGDPWTARSWSSDGSPPDGQPRITARFTIDDDDNLRIDEALVFDDGEPTHLAGVLAHFDCAELETQRAALGQ